ncbi:hypothetical protein ABZ442_04975 [Streptomyces triculaminicus]|uniref:hypothetical protein n=1 Tax=Streptomyces triculaminicus TaxID=2816232 RepID=UPI0033DFD725
MSPFQPADSDLAVGDRVRITNRVDHMNGWHGTIVGSLPWGSHVVDLDEDPYQMPVEFRADELVRINIR